MKTIVAMDDQLLGEALRLTRLRAKNLMINLSLEELARRRRMKGLRARLGRTRIYLTLDGLKQMRRGQ